MNRDEIAAVRRTWSVAMDDPDTLRAVTVSELKLRSIRATTQIERDAAWMVAAIDVLVPLLHRPAAFSTGAKATIGPRLPASLRELAADRDALVDALDRVVGGLSAHERGAWVCATDLFGELVGEHLLDPFRATASMLR